MWVIGQKIDKSLSKVGKSVLLKKGDLTVLCHLRDWYSYLYIYLRDFTKIKMYAATLVTHVTAVPM